MLYIYTNNIYGIYILYNMDLDTIYIEYNYLFLLILKKIELKN